MRNLPALPDSPAAATHRRSLLALGIATLPALWLAGCGSAPRATGTSAGRRRPAPVSALSPEQAHDIAIHALGLVGTPYRYGGNTPEGGFDCSGLIGYVYGHSAGMAPPRTVAALSGFGAVIEAEELRGGDLVLFGGGRPHHAGIYVGERRFVHAPSTGGTVRVDRLDGVYWSRQTLSARRL
ncbi:C40 family peptidase [Xenophilus arseniciresistens]|uniref:C40 family peptidase n=1 Tax=Xenophilus arseniciresistens TaxID=1283306 RepID=A0AAE3NAU3_9BURK|nr:C40 family peptidase [Xenophilus arseniciresistens]MDA7416264.1 C40 family peptidase [Xenophilus arseniciresistens]